MFQYSYAIIAWFVFHEIFHLEEQNHISVFWIIEDFLLSKSKCSSHEKIPTRNWARNTQACVLSKPNNHDFLALPSSKHNFMLKINVSENVSERWKNFMFVFSILETLHWRAMYEVSQGNFVTILFIFSRRRLSSRLPMMQDVLPEWEWQKWERPSEQKCSNEIVKRNNVKCERMSKEYM